jgi:glycosyltransferase involved in cell wall biosynthesis
MSERAETMSGEAEFDITLFVACYNEEQNIVPALENVVSACREVGCTFDIVVVDDGSTDRSVPMIRDYMAQHPDVPIKLIVNGTNLGLGTNYAEACFHGRGKYYRMICGDDEERRESIVKMLSHMGQADLIISCHSDTSERTRLRRFISWAYTTLINLASGHRIQYYNGMVIMRRSDAMRWHTHAHGFGFHADMITRLLDMGATYVEVPTVPKSRVSGRTKAFTFRNFASVGHTLMEILIRRVGRMMYPQYRAKLNRNFETFTTPSFERPASGQRSISSE